MPLRQYRPHCNIVCRSLVCFAQLLEVMCRNTHPQRRTAGTPRVLDGKIFLPHMNAGRAGKRGNVGTIIHDEVHIHWPQQNG